MSGGFDGAVAQFGDAEQKQDGKTEHPGQMLRHERTHQRTKKQRNPQDGAANPTDDRNGAEGNFDLIGPIGKAGDKGVHRERGDEHERLKDCKYRIVQAITAFRLFLHSIPKGKKRDRRLFRRLPALRATVSW